MAAPQASSACDNTVLHDDCIASARVLVKHSVQRPEIDLPAMHAANRARLVSMLAADPSLPSNAVVLLQGGVATLRHETDHEELFRQESNFHWAFGVKEPDVYGSITVATGHSILYIPRLPESYAVWMGPIKSPKAWQLAYGVDEVRYCDELPVVLQDINGVLLLTKGQNSDSKSWAKPASFPGIDKFSTDDSARLWNALAECRVRKSTDEIALLKYIALVSSEAHIAVMQHARAGHKESQLESLFRHWCYYNGGARYLSYTCICASGSNGAVLHYGHAGEPNARTLQKGDLCLFDMGAEFHGYGADITCTFPTNGVFSDDQRLIYEAVLGALCAVLDALKPGVDWVAMHRLAYTVMLTKFRDGGLVRGDVDAMVSAGIGAVFMPHGLGHLLGIDTHDVGGYTPGCPPRPTAPGFSSLHTARVVEEGMYITVEPGCYFIDHVIDAALADPARAGFLNGDVLARFRGFGGVRLEDDVLITSTGCDNFSHVPRTVADIEAVCAGRITQRAQLTKLH